MERSFCKVVESGFSPAPSDLARRLQSAYSSLLSTIFHTTDVHGAFLGP